MYLSKWLRINTIIGKRVISYAFNPKDKFLSCASKTSNSGDYIYLYKKLKEVPGAAILLLRLFCNRETYSDPINNGVRLVYYTHDGKREILTSKGPKRNQFVNLYE